jgi:hypothetical protein
LVNLIATSNLECATFVLEPLQVRLQPSYSVVKKRGYGVGLDAYHQSRMEDAQLAATMQKEACNLRHHLNHAGW